MKKTLFTFSLIVLSLIFTHLFLSEFSLDLSLFGTSDTKTALDESHMVIDFRSTLAKPAALFISLFTYWSWTHLIFSLIFLIPLTYVHESRRGTIHTFLFFIGYHLFGVFIAHFLYGHIAISPYYVGTLFVISALGGSELSRGGKQFRPWMIFYTLALVILAFINFDMALNYFIISLIVFLSSYIGSSLAKIKSN